MTDPTRDQSLTADSEALRYAHQHAGVARRTGIDYCGMTDLTLRKALAAIEQAAAREATERLREAIAEKFDRHGMMSDHRGSWPHEYTNGYHGQQERRECRGCELAALVGIHDDYQRDRMLDIPPQARNAAEPGRQP